jgi:hypothetical protein
VLILAMAADGNVPVVSDEISLPNKRQKAQRKAQWKTSLTDPLAAAAGGAAGAPAGGTPPQQPQAPAEAPPATPPAAPAAEPPAPEPEEEEPKPRKPAQSEPPPEAKAEPAKPPEAPPKPSTLVLGAAFEWGNRRFRHTEPGVVGSQPYDGLGIPGYVFEGELYPLARSDTGILRDIGFTGEFAKALPFSSYCDPKAPCLVDVPPNSDPQSSPVPTTFYRYGAGLRARVRAGPGPNRFTLGISGGYRVWSFDFSDNDPADRAVPTATYRLVRGGLDTRIPLGIFALLARADFLYPLSIAPLGDRSPLETKSLSSHWGADGTLGIGLVATSWLELRLTADYTAFLFKLEPLPVGAGAPGKVLDQYLDVRLGTYLSF